MRAPHHGRRTQRRSSQMLKQMNRRSSRRAVLGGLGSVPLVWRAVAQTRLEDRWIPERPIRLIVPWSAGGSADGHIRVLAEQASLRLGQPVVVENRSGAAGTLGAMALKDARPDGYLLSQMPPGVFRVPLLSSRPGFDPKTDFTWIIQLTGSLLGTVVRSQSPWRTMPELLEHARANPGKLTYGTNGVGSTPHLTMERIALMYGIEWTHVPYRGSADVVTALLGGQLDLAADSSAWAAMVLDGTFRLLCTWGPERPSRFRNAPTLREAGIDIVETAPYGIGGPSRMEPAVVRTLHDVFKDSLYDPAHLAALERFDMPVLYLNSVDYAKAAMEYYAVQRDVINRLGLLPR